MNKSEILAKHIHRNTAYSFDNIMSVEGTMKEMCKSALDAMEEYLSSSTPQTEDARQLAESIFPFEDYTSKPGVNYEYIISKMVEMYKSAQWNTEGVDGITNEFGEIEARFTEEAAQKAVVPESSLVKYISENIAGLYVNLNESVLSEKERGYYLGSIAVLKDMKVKLKSKSEEAVVPVTNDTPVKDDAIEFAEWLNSGENPFALLPNGRWIQSCGNSTSWTTEQLYKLFLETNIKSVPVKDDWKEKFEDDLKSQFPFEKNSYGEYNETELQREGAEWSKDWIETNIINKP